MELTQTLWQMVLVIAWVAWWLWGANWRKTWRVLGDGAWAPLVLLLLVVALVWSRLDPADCSCLGLVTVPKFWSHLGQVSLLLAVAFVCGWLQGVFGWTPEEIDLEPPTEAGHDHGHHH